MVLGDLLKIKGQSSRKVIQCIDIDIAYSSMWEGSHTNGKIIEELKDDRGFSLCE